MSGLEIIKAIQSVNSLFLDRFFGFMTDLHHADTYLLLFPFLLWLYDKRFARYMATVLLLGIWINGALKSFFDTPRPPADAVRKLYLESGTGPAFPSGHAQNPLMFWGALALHFRRTWLSLFLGALIFLIGYSRLYGGLHWPIDVLGGWIIGASCLLLFERTRGFWEGEGMSLRSRLLLGAGVPLAALLVWHTGNWNSPVAEVDDSWKLIGAYMGFWVGSFLEEEYVGFNPRAGTWITHLVKLVLGVVVVFGLRSGLKAALPAIAVSDLIRYTLVTLAASFLLPWIFHRFVVPAPAGHQNRRQHNL